MFVVVEGVSAVGKSTWCGKHAQHLRLGELRFPDPEEFLNLDPNLTGRFWAHVNAARWRLALEMEAQNGTVVCDEDPLKLHYTYCLARLGEVARSAFDAHATEVRAMIAARTLGFADIVLYKDISPEELRAQKQNDLGRRRSRFELHSRFLEPLRDWYLTLAKIRPGRVVIGLPDTGMGSLTVPASLDRYDLSTFDALLAGIP